jgi:hypothetical protein
MIDYYATSVLHLSLEDYFNAGIPPERSKELIEGIRDVVGTLNLWCEPSGINHNWNVRTRANTTRDQYLVVFEITCALEDELRRMKVNVEKQSVQ